MEEFEISIKNKGVILALGAESAGNFSICTPSSLPSPLGKGRTKEGLSVSTVYFSQDFGDLLNEHNFLVFKTEVLKFLKNKKITPDVILSDLHPDFNTTQLAKELAKKYKAQYLPVQHHLAHVFSALGDEFIHNTSYKIPATLFGIACDGTGLGFDGKIWGGEVFKIAKRGTQNVEREMRITRIGHLENQIMIGGEMAIKEPARMLISILAKIYPPSRVIPGSRLASTNNHLCESRQVTRNPDSRHHNDEKIYKYLKKYYSKNEFEVLWNQFEQNFNCLETSSTARILDAVSVLLGFSKNERFSKHGPIELLEKNSTTPYKLKPRLENYKLKIPNSKQITNSNPPAGEQESNEMLILNTTYLFEYLIKNINKDKSRLAATAQKYIADGIFEIISLCHPERSEGSRDSSVEPQNDSAYFAGGMANNPIMSKSLTSHGTYTNKKIPRGDAGLSFGQIFFYLLSK